MQLFSFWKDKKVYEVRVRKYKIKIYKMEEEFGQEEDFSQNLSDVKMLFVEIIKNRKKINFIYIISKEKYYKEDFTEVIHEATYKWRNNYYDDRLSNKRTY